MFESETELTLYHEAGHCVMAVLFGAEVERATVAPEEDGFHGIVDIRWSSSASIADQLYVALAGPVAELIYRGETFEPYLVGQWGLVPEWVQDWQQAWSLARRLKRSDHDCIRLIVGIACQLHDWFQRDNWWSAIAAVSDMLDAHEEIDHEAVEYEVKNWIDG